MTTADLEKRLTAIEQELAQLRQERQSKPHPAQVLAKIHGTFENDDAFREAMRLGQKWRRSERSNGRSAKAKRR